MTNIYIKNLLNLNRVKVFFVVFFLFILFILSGIYIELTENGIQKKFLKFILLNIFYLPIAFLFVDEFNSIIRISPQKKFIINIIFCINFIFSMIINVFFIQINQLIWSWTCFFIILLIYESEFKNDFLKTLNSVFFLIYLNIFLLIFGYFYFYSIKIIFFLSLITILNDTIAYLIGKNCKIKLTIISPKKTLFGTVNSLLLTVFFFLIIDFLFNVSNIFFNYWEIFFLKEDVFFKRISFLVIICFISISSHLGDLLFSYVKRNLKIKDFSRTLQAHGGILDRFDSISLTFISFFLFSLLIKIIA